MTAFLLHPLELPGIELALDLLTVGVIYFGLRERKHWVVPFALIESIAHCCWSIARVFEPADRMTALFAKIAILLMIYFYAYQVVFFRKSEVKRFFGEPGLVLFC